jgi:glycosyltransferase involved in cell wall biosynthesis
VTRISIVIPSFQQGLFIERTLRSVLACRDPNLEVIVVDGGSTDATCEILEHYADRLAWWCSEPDRGQSHAINKGLQKATGGILCYLNSDDLHMPWTVREVRRTFERQPQLAFVYSDTIMIDAEDSVIGWTYSPGFEPERRGYDLKSETVFWSRWAMDKAGTFDESLQFAMDMDYFCRLYVLGPVRKIERPLGCFRCHAAAKSATMSDVREVESRRIWKQHFGNEVFRRELKRTRKDWLMHCLMPLRFPLCLGLPYASQRARRALRSRAANIS